MGRELRKVPSNWEHPRTKDGFQPLFDESYKEASKKWKQEFLEWEKNPESDCEYWEWDGNPPDPKYYRPDWPEEIRTHYQMYETCSEGTPISPVMDNIDDLAKWLTDNNASVFGNMTTTYEKWLEICENPP